MARVFIVLAAFLGFTGVALGAFAAHGLKAQLSAAYLAVFQTGVQYQNLHALALFAVGLLALQVRSAWLTAAGALFVAGVVLFSGSLYLLTLTSIGKLGMVTPLGGVLLLGGWLCVGVGAVRWRTEARLS